MGDGGEAAVGLWRWRKKGVREDERILAEREDFDVPRVAAVVAVEMIMAAVEELVLVSGCTSSSARVPLKSA